MVNYLTFSAGPINFGIEFILLLIFLALPTLLIGLGCTMLVLAYFISRSAKKKKDNRNKKRSEELFKFAKISLLSGVMLYVFTSLMMTFSAC